MISCIQVEECSLRGQLMQLHQRVAVADQSQKDTNNSSLNAVNMRWWFDFEPLKRGHQKFPARILLCRLYHTKWTQWPAWFICLSIIVRSLININILQNLSGVISLPNGLIYEIIDLYVNITSTHVFFFFKYIFKDVKPENRSCH